MMPNVRYLTKLKGSFPLLECLRTFSDVAILILVFNAAKDCPTMIELLEKPTPRHYIYLKDSYPHLVPKLEHLFKNESNLDLDVNLSNCDNFFLKIFERLRTLVSLDKCSIQVQMSVLSNAIR